MPPPHLEESYPPKPKWAEVNLDYILFYRMMAKIAHGLAVWTYGLDGIRSFLCDIIMGTDLTKCEYYIGGNINKIPPTTHLHLEIAEIDNKKLLAAIRIFGDLADRNGFGSPIYLAIVGERIE